MVAEARDDHKISDTEEEAEDEVIERVDEEHQEDQADQPKEDTDVIN